MTSLIGVSSSTGREAPEVRVKRLWECAQIGRKLHIAEAASARQEHIIKDNEIEFLRTIRVMLVEQGVEFSARL